ncbi:MAG TPA: hypothetical protein VGM76_01145, partial [Lacipirellulaceae bacterium]
HDGTLKICGIPHRTGCTRTRKGGNYSVETNELEQRSKFLDRQAGIPHNSAHGDGVDGVVAGDDQFAFAIGHNHVLALPQDFEAGPLEGPDRVQMIDAGQFGHS